MAAMRMFRRSEVQVTAGPRGKPIARVYHSDEKEPIPLALHHIPVCVTLGLFSTAAAKGDAEYTYIVDPTEREEAALDGRISFAINAHREVCAIHKLGGLALAVDDVIRACALCAAKAAQLHEVLNLAVNEAEGTELTTIDGAPKSTPLTIAWTQRTSEARKGRTAAAVSPRRELGHRGGRRCFQHRQAAEHHTSEADIALGQAVREGRACAGG